MIDMKRAAGEELLERLIGEAVATAAGYGIEGVGADHLMFVIAGTEDGRRALESAQLDAVRIREFLSEAFEELASVGGRSATCQAFHASLRASIDAPVRAAREAGREVAIADIVRQMLRVGEESDASASACGTLREALRAGRGRSARGNSMIDPAFLSEMGLEAGAESTSRRPRDGEAPGWGDGEADIWAPDNRACEEIDADLIAALSEQADPSGRGAPDGAAAGEAGAADDASDPDFDMSSEDTDFLDADRESADEHGDAVRRALRDVTAEAAAGRLDFTVGREALIARMGEVICRRRKRNVLLSGAPGVGKTAAVEGLAEAIVGGRVPGIARTCPVWEIRLGDLVSGTRLRGDFEARMVRLIEMVTEARAILFVDEVHTLMGAGGAAGAGSLDGANILKPALARGSICMIGATTPGELAALRRDGAMMRRFEVIDVPEPSRGETRRILELGVSGYVLHHEIMVSAAALDAAVDLADRYIAHRKFPDKAFDLVDTACVVARHRGVSEVESADVFAALDRMPGVRSPGSLRTRDHGLDDLEARLDARLHGQTEAVTQLARIARTAALGLSTSGPAASALLTGPTGSGKTSAVAAYAAELGLPLVTISLSEYTEAHSVARLIGAPPGYVGFDAGGLLSEAVEAHDRFVLLLDEIDKAHDDVFDILMQILDRGIVRTGDGREVSCAGAQIFMNANLGATAPSGANLGFGRSARAEDVVDEAVRARFRPEFVGRLGSIIRFGTLDAAALAGVARAQLSALAQRLSDAGMGLTGEEGWDARFAARFEGAPDGARALVEAFRFEVIDRVSIAVLDGASGLVLSCSEDGQPEIAAAAARP